jgi:hypothetical protein
MKILPADILDPMVVQITQTLMCQTFGTPPFGTGSSWLPHKTDIYAPGSIGQNGPILVKKLRLFR